MGIHVECAPPHPFPAEPLVAAASLPSGDGIAFPLTSSEGIETLASLFREVPVVAHDAKRLFLAAAALGIAPPSRVVDVMLESYVVSPGIHAHDLSGDARGVLDLPPESIPSLKELAGKEGLSSAEPLASEAGLAYLAPRARLPLALETALGGKLAAAPALRTILAEIEQPLIPVLARMEIAGIAVDRGTLAILSKEFGERLAALEANIHEAAGEAFNIGSPQQLGRILFEKLAYPSLRKTAKTKAYATGSDVLEELASLETGPVPGLVLEWRELSKLKGTYLDALPEFLAKDGRIHTRYDQAVAATGRLSSNDPNLQNIPVRTEAGRQIRRAFVAPKGRLLVTADYSQVELRILAHLSGDEALIDVFRRGEDIHRATAAKMFGIPLEKVTADQRRSAKTINFGILYGMGAFALAGQLGVPRAEAKEFITAYFDRFPKVRACLDGVLEKARETGRTETIFGRVRPIPGLSDRNHAVRANAERMAMNAPFQGSAADLIKRAMITLDAALSREIPSVRPPPSGARRAGPRVRREGRRRGRGPRASDDGRRRVARRPSHGRRRARRELGRGEVTRAGRPARRMALVLPNGSRLLAALAAAGASGLLSAQMPPPTPIPVAPGTVVLRPIEAIPESWRPPPQELPYAHPLYRPLDAPPKLPERPPLEDFEARTWLWTCVKVGENGRVTEGAAVEPPLKGLTAPLAALFPRWRFAPPRKEGKPVTTWATLGLNLAVSLEKGLFSSFDLKPLAKEDPIPSVVREIPPEDFLKGFPNEIAPPEPGVLSVEECDAFPAPDSIKWSFDAARSRSRITALVLVSEEGKVARILPTGETNEPLVLDWLRKNASTWKLTPGMAAGKPVASWMSLDAALDYTIDSAKKKAERAVRKNLRGTRTDSP